ncbi:substrate-binding domain-containing protein [Paraburkholderia sp. RL18-103-BIB-C]|uniref:molybdate ABC transporter substrate-binding protein n=1 Tax=Paraburkholderia sp. RL18-103-BIB-C TaxID=3031637 RepID=UPI0038BA89AD
MQLNVLGAGASEGILQAMQEEFLATTGAEVKGIFGAVSAIKERLDSGETCDVIILTAPMLHELKAQDRLLADTTAALGHVATGIAVRAGEALPRIDENEQLAARLKQADAIFFPDPLRATAGIHFVGVLKKLGIYADIEARLRPLPNGALAMAELAQSTDANALGCTQVTEILYSRGVSLAGVLPKGFELSTLYAAAVSRDASDPDLARRFIAFLTGVATAKLREGGGFIV